MDTAVPAVQASSTSSQQNSQTEIVNILAHDVNSRQLMAVGFFNSLAYLLNGVYAALQFISSCYSTKLTVGS